MERLNITTDLRAKINEVIRSSQTLTAMIREQNGDTSITLTVNNSLDEAELMILASGDGRAYTRYTFQLNRVMEVKDCEIEV